MSQEAELDVSSEWVSPLPDAGNPPEPPKGLDKDEAADGPVMTLSLLPRPRERGPRLFGWVFGASLLVHAPAAAALAGNYHAAHRERVQQVEIEMMPPPPPEPPPEPPPPPPPDTPPPPPREIPHVAHVAAPSKPVTEPTAPVGDVPNIVATPGELAIPASPGPVGPPEPPAPAAPPPPPPPPPPLIEAREGVHYRSNPRPAYPRLAAREGWEGTVLLRVEIGPDGHVHHATLERSSGHAVLDEAALGVIGTWLFDAATQGGRPVASTHTVPIQFHLEQ